AEDRAASEPDDRLAAAPRDGAEGIAGRGVDRCPVGREAPGRPDAAPARPRVVGADASGIGDRNADHPAVVRPAVTGVAAVRDVERARDEDEGTALVLDRRAEADAAAPECSGHVDGVAGADRAIVEREPED